MEAEDWDARYAASPELQWGTAPNRWLVQEVATLPAGTALDLGAGEGRNAIWLARHGWRVTAVDFSRVGLATGRRLAEEAAQSTGQQLAIEWVVADVRAYQPAPARYDLVLLAYLHLPEAQRPAVMRAAAAGVAPGGILLVIGHDRTNLTEGYGGPPDPSVLFTAEDILADLAEWRRTGRLQVERAERVDRPVDTAEGLRVARDALVRLVRR
ncbi:MAG TPA: class I SAM-dependent methyltransferase [Natronosporangium sp.]|nr:class I SAM-dependent methyltransferase [Natronosporangium sp.]